MGIMNFLRERMGTILAVVIGLALFAFIVGEVARSGSSFFHDARNEVGEIAGKEISYTDYQKRVDETVKNFQQQSGQSLTPQLTSFAQEQAWNQFISQIILTKEVEKLGLVVGVAETHDMIQGNNPNPQIVQYFGDPKTGKVDPTRLKAFLGQMAAMSDTSVNKKQWNDFVAQMIQGKQAEKYMTLVRNGLYVNSLDARDDYEAKNKLVNFKYAELPYSSIADNQVTLTDDDYNTYYNEHKTQFKNQQELRSFDYVSFNAAPSKEDSAATKEQIQKLVEPFKTSTNDSAFVQINAETKAPLVFQHKGQLEPKLDSIMFSAAKGTVYGPYFDNGSYKLAKLIDSRVGPDSVKASHILISPQTEGSIEKAQQKADSLKKLIQGGASFADLAKKYSIDKQSGEKGGDLGTFGRGAMVPAFEDAVFDGKAGDLKTVTTQFGVHIIKIESQKGSSKVVKVAVVDKPLQPSNKTQSAGYSRAQTFLASVNADNFNAEAKKEGLQVKTAADVTGIAASVAGLDNARDVIRWAFKADKGDIADQVYTVGYQYVIPHLTVIKPEGQLPVDAVKQQIEGDVRQMVKGKKLAEKLQAALNGSSNIDQVAQKAGTRAVPVQNIVFANPVIPGLSAEYKVIGTVFGLGVNKLSKPVDGANGVYVVAVDGFVNPAPLTNALRQKQLIEQTLLQRSDSQVFDALKDKANVKDYRAKLL